MKDIQLIKPLTSSIVPTILGKTNIEGLILYQKIITLLLSSSSGLYRNKAGTKILDMLLGANIPPDSILLSIGVSACGLILLCLDSSDIQNILELTAYALNGRLNIVLKLIDGQSYEGYIV